MSNDWRQSFQENVINSFIFTVQLPSTGQIIKFKPIDTKTLKKLLIYEKSEDFAVVETLLDEILLSCIIEPENFNIDNMLIFDRIFLLFEIRKMSKGESIQTTWTCPACNSQSLQYLNFNKFKFIEYKDPENKLIPIANNVYLELRYFTRSDQKEVNLRLQANPNSNRVKGAESTLNMLAASINAYIVGDNRYENLTLDDKLEMFDALSDSVMEAIKKWHEDNRFGYDISFTYDCPHCRHKVTQSQDMLQSL